MVTAYIKSDIHPGGVIWFWAEFTGGGYCLLANAPTEFRAGCRTQPEAGIDAWTRRWRRSAFRWRPSLETVAAGGLCSLGSNHFPYLLATPNNFWT